ncbi:MAG: hypothetical protein QXQ48_08390 [Nitrososphaerota archaeon]
MLGMAEEDNYISMQAIYGAPRVRNTESEAGIRLPKKRLDDDLDDLGGFISARDVFYIVAATAIVTAVVNPSLLIYTLPVSVFVSAMFALAKRRNSRHPRRIKVVE